MIFTIEYFSACVNTLLVLLLLVVVISRFRCGPVTLGFGAGWLRAYTTWCIRTYSNVGLVYQSQQRHLYQPLVVSRWLMVNILVYVNSLYRVYLLS